MCAGLTGLAFLLRAPTFVERLFDPDEAAIGVQAMVVRSGGTLYTDIFDRKPPLPPLLYAASFALTDSTDIRLVRVLVTLVLAASGILVAMECLRRWGPRHAWLGGILMITGAMALFPADAGAANYAHFALLPGTAAIIWSRRGTLLTAVAAGIAIGVAILSRQSWLLGVVPMVSASACTAVGATSSRRVPPERSRSSPRVVRAAGPLLGVERHQQPELRVRRHRPVDRDLEGLGIVRRIRRVPSRSGRRCSARVPAGIAALRRRAPADIDLWIWIATGVAAWAAGCGSSATTGCRSCRRWCCSRFRSSPAGPAGRTAAIAGIAVPAVVAWVLLFVPGSFHERPDPTTLAKFVAANTTSADRVFVWGSYPEVLVAAQRLPAGSLVHTDFVVGRSGGRNDPAETLSSGTGARQIMLDSLAAHPPELILDTSTSSQLGYENFPISLIPELDQFVHDGYELITTVDGVDIWRRR
jgi:hypothetical protein